MKKPIEYQTIVDEFIREYRERPLVFKSPRSRKQKQLTLTAIHALNLPDTTVLEAEWTDTAGYHRVPVTGVWESESGAVVLTAGDERVVTERMD